MYWDQFTPAVKLSLLYAAPPNTMFSDSGIGILKSTKVGVFTPRKLANATKKGCPQQMIQLFKIYQYVNTYVLVETLRASVL